MAIVLPLTATTRTLLKEHGGLIFMGFLLFFFSVFGQSLAFGIYIPALEMDLGLTKTQIGSLYAAATIASAVAIIFSGKALDHMRLRDFIALTCVGVSVGCFLMAGAVGPLSLFLAFFILRQFGQGLMVLSASTSINRYLETGRGKAVALITLGGSAHLMVFPLLALSLEQYLSWRQAWLYYGVFVLLVLLPGFWFYLRKHQSKTHARWEARIRAESENAVKALQKQWTRTHVITNWRFYALVALAVVPPFVGTAIFFYQRELADNLGLSAIAFAAAFPVFTLFTIICSLGAGVFIDKYGEKWALALYPMTYTVGLALLTLIDAPGLWAIYIGMGLLGAGAGIMSTTGGPLIARLYGTEHLGSIKSLLFSVSILSSALSPVLFGFLIDQGYAITTLLSGVIYYTAFVWLLAFPLCKNIAAPPQTEVKRP